MIIEQEMAEKEIYTERKNCRLCEGSFKEVLDLGPIHISTFVDTNDNPSPKVPITLVQCVECGLMQLQHTVSGDAMYSEYWYQSGLNSSMVTALKDVVDSAKTRYGRVLTWRDTVVDIGANDGTLLKNYGQFTDNEHIYPNVPATIAFEPSNLHTLISGDVASCVINGYFSAEVYHKVTNRKAKIITAIAMFYDLENPHTFVADVKETLDDQGIFVVQMMDLVSMITTSDFPNLCHEHLEYYTLEVFKRLMEQHDLRVFDVEYNTVNGGSLRAYVCHNAAQYTTSDAVQKALAEEKEFLEDLGDVGEYFKTRVEDVKEKVVSFTRLQNEEGRQVAVAGASTKGNLILEYMGLTDKDIVFAAEINKDKYGKRTIGTNVPIIPEKLALALQPDVFFILPWGFLNTFIKNYREYLDKGGKLLVPLPIPRVISVEDNVIISTPL